MYKNPVQLYFARLAESDKKHRFAAESAEKKFFVESSPHKKKLGRSIEERDKKINDREELGHLECDLIVGNRSDDDVILNIVERKRDFHSHINCRIKKFRPS